MNNQGEVTVTWGDGDYTFRLTVTGLIELEEKCSAPFATVWHRVNVGEFGVNDVRETIRLGLIGGGMGPADAMRLVRRYLDDRLNIVGMAEHINLVRLILSGVMFGFQASPLGNVEAAPEQPLSASTPQPSPEPPDLLESVLASWDRSVSGNFLPS